MADNGSIMLNQNPPEVLKKRIGLAKQTKKVNKTLTANLNFWDENID